MNDFIFYHIFQVTYEGEANYPPPSPPQSQGHYGAPSNNVQNQGYIY